MCTTGHLLTAFQAPPLTPLTPSNLGWSIFRQSHPYPILHPCGLIGLYTRGRRTWPKYKMFRTLTSWHTSHMYIYPEHKLHCTVQISFSMEMRNALCIAFPSFHKSLWFAHARSTEIWRLCIRVKMKIFVFAFSRKFRKFSLKYRQNFSRKLTGVVFL